MIGGCGMLLCFVSCSKYSMKPVSIVIYEDNNILRESLCSLIRLSNDFEVLGAFPNCQEAEGQVQGYKPDVILMDIDMPGINGIEAVKKIRTVDSVVQIIMLTVFDDNTHVFNALCAGANGYLLKKYISDKLFTAIQEVLQGGAPMSPAIARMVINNMQEQAVTPPDNYQLTKREKEILSSLSKGNSYKLIAADLGIGIETVRSHLKKVYDKLHVNSQTEAVSKAINEKLV
jgi:DNA-binding NarL/FixJ family response regulator